MVLLGSGSEHWASRRVRDYFRCGVAGSYRFRV